MEKSKECQIVLYCATDNNALPQIYLKWKFLYAYLCQNLQYFCNSDTKIKLRHQKGVDCTFFGIFSELLRGTAKFWRSKNENIAFLSDWLMPIFSFTLKGSISAVSDLLGHFSSAKIKSPKQVDFGCHDCSINSNTDEAVIQVPSPYY